MTLLGPLLLMNREPPQAWDQATHLSLAADIADRFAGRVPYPSRLSDMARFYPPFFHTLVAVGFSLFGLSTRAALAVNLLMLVVLAAATYRIAAIVVGREAAALAAGLALASPVAFSLARQPLIDLSLTALVAVAVAQTLSPRFLGSWKAIAATSVVWGLGLLTKWVFPVFLAGPLTLWISHQTARGSRRAAVTVLVAAFGAALVAAPWYAPRAEDLVARASASASMGTTEGDPAGLSTASLGYYPLLALDG